MRQVPREVREAAALWAANFIYLSESNYRYSHGGRIIPQNRAVKRYLAEANAWGKRHVIPRADGTKYVMDYSLHSLAEDLGYRADPELRERVLQGKRRRR